MPAVVMGGARAVSGDMGLQVLVVSCSVLVLFPGSTVSSKVASCERPPMGLQVLSKGCLEELFSCNTTYRRKVSGLDHKHLPPSVKTALCKSRNPSITVPPALQVCPLQAAPVLWHLYCLQEGGTAQLQRVTIDEWSDTVIKGVNSILKQDERQKVVFIYSSTKESLALPLARALADGWVVTREQLTGTESSSQLRATLTEWARHRVRVLYVVLCDRHTLQTLLIQVNDHDKTEDEQGILTFLSHWLFVIDSGSLDTYLTNIGNITNALVIKSPNQETDGNIKEGDLIYHSGIQSFVIDKTLCYDATLPQQNTSSRAGAIRLYHTKWITTSHRGLEQLALWTADHIPITRNLYPNMQYGFNGRHLIIVTVIWPPFVEIVRVSNQSVSMGGFMGDVLEAMSEALNFTFSVVEPPDNRFGSFDDSGRWDGMVGELVRKKADLICAPITITPQRETVIDYSIAHFFDRDVTVYLKPPAENAQLYLFLKPFRLEMWLTILPAIVFTSLILFLLGRGGLFNQPNGASICGDGSILKTFLEELWSSIGSILNQGSTTIPTSWASRWVFIFWRFCGVILAATYSGNLIAFLTVTGKQDPPFTTYQELCDNNDYAFGVLGGSNFHTALQVATSGARQCLYKEALQYESTGLDVFSDNNTYLVDLVKKGGFAYLVDNTEGTRIRSENCDIAALEEAFSSGLPYGIGLQNNSAYTDMVNTVIRSLRMSGLLIKWQRDHWPNPDSCRQSNQAQQIAFSHIKGIILYCSVAICIAIAVFLCEIFMNAKDSRQS